MPYKTWRKRREETISKAYFQYWQFQNNPDYVEFYVQNFTPQRLNDEGYSTWARRLGLEQKIESTVCPQLEQKFKLSYPFPVDPFKKIDWSDFETILLKPDREILKTFRHFQKNGGGPIVSPFSPHLFEYAPSAVLDVVRKLDGHKYPFCFIPNVVDYDKEEIFELMSQQIDSWRKWKMIQKLRHRDHVNKFHLYAHVWELRKGWDRKTFPEIAKMITANISTVKSRFYRAYELIFNKPFDTNLFIKLRNRVRKESLAKYCEICREYKTCRGECPDILPFIDQDKVKRNWREVQPSESNPKIKAHLGLDG